MRRIARTLVVVGLFSLLAFSIYAVFLVSSTDFSPEKSSALYGGQFETGYPAAGFLIIYTANSIKTCGYTAIRPNVAVTAGHCVDDAERIYLGQGEFNFNHSEHAFATKAQPKEGWAVDKRREDDFAILTFQDSNFFRDFADISSPIEGCNFRVVAYGRTEDQETSSSKERRSGILCANAIYDKVFYVTGKDGGICFGDSGSPVFFEGTSNLAGVVASIIKVADDNSDPCAVGNSAIIVRADTNTELINNAVSQASPSSDPVAIDDTLVIEVASESESAFPVFSFSSVENLVTNSERFLPQIVLVAAGFVVLISAFLALSGKGSEAAVEQPMQF